MYEEDKINNEAPTDKRPIGVFDSGIGGITVLSALRNLMPNENYIYFGDTGRVPYGSKSPDVVTEYSVQIANFLREMDAKCLVVACNTASATAGDLLEDLMDIPVIGVIDPTARNAVAATKKRKIGVIGTRNTVGSHAYQRTIHAINPEIEVNEVACPMFVPYIEENETNAPGMAVEIKRYLTPLVSSGVDTIILGCTHYPLIKDNLQQAVGKDITLIDSAHSTSVNTREILEEGGLLNKAYQPDLSFFVTGGVNDFASSLARFGLPGMHIHQVQITTLKQPPIVNMAKPYSVKQGAPQ